LGEKVGESMKALITGGAGFIGANLAKHLKSKGNEITVMDNLVRRGSELNLPLLRKEGIKFVHGDIRNIEDFVNLSGGYNFIFETAAQPSACTGYDNPIFDIKNNFEGLLNVLQYAKLNDSKVIFWSTNKVYCGDKINKYPVKEGKTRFISDLRIDENFSIDGGDHSIYGLSKICADLTCQEWMRGLGSKVVINRFSCLAGPGQFGKSEQGWIAWFIIAAFFKLPITLYGFKGKQVRDVLFLPDILNLVDIQIEKFDKINGEVFNIGGGDKVNTSLLECIKIIEDVTGNDIDFSLDPNKRKADQCVYISDTAKAKKVLGWQPKVGLREGIYQTYLWVLENIAELKELYNIS
jgi:CDP-paratose 2-epimerase